MMGQRRLFERPRLTFRWRHPVGTRVQLRYGRRYIHSTRHHGAMGTVLLSPLRRGPKNHLVQIDAGARVVVPVGNIRAIVKGE
jgi:hypothetical protein